MASSTAGGFTGAAPCRCTAATTPYLIHQLSPHQPLCLHATIALRPSVRPSVTRRYCTETTARIELFLATEASFHLSYNSTMCCKEIRIPPKRRVLPSGTLSRTLYLENFANVSPSCCQLNSSAVELVDYTYDGRRVVSVYYTSADPNALHYFDLLWICCTTCSCTCAAVNKISTDSAPLCTNRHRYS